MLIPINGDLEDRKAIVKTLYNGQEIILIGAVDNTKRYAVFAYPFHVKPDGVILHPNGEINVLNHSIVPILTNELASDVLKIELSSEIPCGSPCSVVAYFTYN